MALEGADLVPLRARASALGQHGSALVGHPLPDDIAAPSIGRDTHPLRRRPRGTHRPWICNNPEDFHCRMVRNTRN